MIQPVIDTWVNGVESKGLPGKAMMADLATFAQKYK